MKVFQYFGFPVGLFFSMTSFIWKFSGSEDKVCEMITYEAWVIHPVCGITTKFHSPSPVGSHKLASNICAESVRSWLQFGLQRMRE